MDKTKLSATEAARAIRDGQMTSVDLVVACLERINQVEASVDAWVSLRPEHSLAQAKSADRHQSDGHELGLLHGVPVGIKDIFDTVDFPTEQGSPIFAGRQPGQDAEVVSRLRAAGAVILGKTVTTEFAGWTPGKTTNPHDPSRTPGGSSSGSAAAVAAHMVPLAIGSQTAGSTIRPGSFCGVVAFKPQFGAISRTGGMYLSQSLDHVGLFARTVEDVALLHDVLCGPDEEDDATLQAAASAISPVLAKSAERSFNIGFAQTPFFSLADVTTQTLVESYCQNHDLRLVALPENFEHANHWLSCISAVETAANFDDLYPAYAEQISARFQSDLKTGVETSAIDYLNALEGQKRLRSDLWKTLQSYDAVVTLAACGEAPIGLEATGDPSFCSPWTLMGTPSVTVPVLTGPNGLPIGLQVIGMPGRDVRVLEVARFLMEKTND